MCRNIIGITVIVTLTILFTGCNQIDNEENNDKSKTETAIPVKTGKIEKGNFYTERTVLGRTQTKKQTPVMLEQPSEIKKLNVENGDNVKEDDNLATIASGGREQTIQSPADGTVGQLDVDEGTTISNEDPVLLIVDLDKMTAKFSVTSVMRDLLTKGEKEIVYIGDEKYEGKVRALDTMPEDTGQFPVKVDIDNEDGDILPGMTAKLVVKKLEEKDAIIIPTNAIVTQNDENDVFIVDESHAKKVEVEILNTQSEKTAVNAALGKEDEIIIEGQHMLTDGNLIDIKDGNTQ